MKRTRTIVLTLGALVVAVATGGPTPLQAQQQQQQQKKGGAKEIELPRIEERLPDGPGRDAVMSACVLCHSTRYITMQPAFPREVWVASVDKMRKVFGAPVTNEQAAIVVDYLVAIRGKPAGAAKQ